MEFENLSNGKTDGFTLFYLKGGKLKTVLLTKDQAETLDLMLGVSFGDSKANITDVDKKVIKEMI